jgi:peptide/nickel transport system substrate-binding protein
MRSHPTAACLAAIVLAFAALSGCTGGGGSSRDAGQPFVAVLDTKPDTFDPLDGLDASSYRLQQITYNALLRKNEKFEYVGDLASDYSIAEDGRSVTFNLREGVTFHDGRPFTSADAKYTLDFLLGSTKKKAAPFFMAAPKPAAGAAPAPNSAQPAQPAQRTSYIEAVETPDPRTLVVRLRRPWPQLLPNLVAVPVIPEGSAETQGQKPVGTGPFKYAAHDEGQLTYDYTAHETYWQGAPAIKKLRLRTILDANTLQAELQSGRIDIAPGPSNLSPDVFNFMSRDPALKVEQFPGANIQYLGFNVEQPPLDNVKVRQAIAHAIDREVIVRDLLLGQARIAHSVLPESSWAFEAGQKYAYDPARSAQLLDEAGFRDPDGDGPRMRFDRPLVFKIPSGNAATAQFVGVIQNSLKAVGVPASIETLETSTLIPQLSRGQFEMTTLRWVGGNQDPVFLFDLFHSGEIPAAGRSDVRNRSRYRNPQLDQILTEALAAVDRSRSRELYVRAQQMVSQDVPMLPLWYPDIMVIARRDVENIAVDPSNDFSFLKNVRIAGR